MGLSILGKLYLGERTGAGSWIKDSIERWLGEPPLPSHGGAGRTTSVPASWGCGVGDPW